MSAQVADVISLEDRRARTATSGGRLACAFCTRTSGKLTWHLDGVCKEARFAAAAELVRRHQVEFDTILGGLLT